MRNLKKFLALVLATLMVVSAAATVSAFDDVAEDNQYAAAIDKLVEYGITNGVDESNFAPDNDVERYQMALFMARALKPGETDWSNGMEIFDDVEEYYGAIAFAYTEGIVTGIGNNLFAPHAGIRYQDALIMALRALGYEVDVTGDPYWLAAYTKASEIGLTKNVAVTKGEKTLTRAETAQVIYNMLKAVPADGGLTIEQKNFGIAAVENTTTFVITATANQAYTGKDDVVVGGDGKYVALQLLNDDGTLGDGFFAEFAKLGFDEDVEPDDVIGYSVGLVNFDNGKFDSAIPTEAVTVMSNRATTVSGNKITINNKVYYLVDEYTENTLKNELIVKDDSGVIATYVLADASDLYFNTKGNVVDKTGKELAIKQDVTSYNGQTLYALASEVEKDAFLLYTADELTKVPAIVSAYNESTVVGGYADVEKLGGAFQLTLFDDDGNGTYDRAISTPVYMSVYNTPKDGKYCTVKGPAEGAENTKLTKNLVKGDIFVYTYNKQTNVIDVLDVVAIDYGTIEKINLTASKSADYTVKISGETYKFGAPNDGATIGATLKKANEGKLNDENTIGKIVSEPALDYVNINNFITSATVGSTVKFYAYNGYIVYAESYDVEESFNLVAVKEITDYDSDAVYFNMYVDGKYIEDAAVSEILFNGKTTAFSSLNAFKLSQAITACSDYANKIFKGIKLEDGTYRLGVELTANNAETPVKNGGFGYTEYAIDGNVEFADGLSNDTKANRIRTDSNTVFYFVNDNGIKVVTTSAKDSTIYTNRNTQIFVDKLGYSGNFKGIATKVIVLDYVSVEGFGISSTVNTIVYVPSAYDVNKYEVDTAANFGLNANNDGVFYLYKNAAIDMSDGSTVSIYSSKKITAGKAYQVDDEGVTILNDGTLTPIELTNENYFDSKVIDKGSVVTDDRYLEIVDLFGQKDEVDTIKAQLLSHTKIEALNAGDFKGKIADDKTATIYYLAKDGEVTDLKDGIFVAIYMINDAPKVEYQTRTIEVEVVEDVTIADNFAITVELYKVSDGATVKSYVINKTNINDTIEATDLLKNVSYDIRVAKAFPGYDVEAAWESGYNFVVTIDNAVVEPAE